jgi:thiosulfate/3-mercaptopyruvate sulfurtransferase
MSSFKKHPLEKITGGKNMLKKTKAITLASIILLLSAVAVTSAFAAGSVKPLVSTQWVADNMSSIKIIDVSKKGYAKGHIPGAVQVKWGSEVFAPETDHMVLGLAEIERVMSKMGITPDDHIVLYDGDGKHHHVTRVYWTLKYWHFPKVSIMDGDINLWKSEKRPVTTEMTKVSRKNVEVQYPPNTKIRAMYSPDIIHALATGEAIILDSRSKDFFDGKVYSLNKWVRSGHITGSLNVFTKDSLNKDNTFKPISELKAMYENAGITADKNIITNCDTGVLATHSWFVLHELLGYKNVKVYDGSMREYANMFDTPMVPGVVGGQFPKTPIQELQEKVK